MADKKITVPSEYIDDVLNLIEHHLHKIGKTYQANNRSYADDCEISAFQRMARQLGYEFELTSVGSEFEINRREYRILD